MAWLWRKKDKDPEPDQTRDDTASAGSDDGIMRQEQASTGDWMTLPPMATNGPMPTTFRVQTLPEIMTTHQSPRVSGSLGHAVSALAPSGIVSGLAVGTGAVRSETAAGAELPLRVPHGPSVEEDAVPVQRALPIERPLPVVPPVSTLPEPPVSRTLGVALPLASPVDGGRDLPVARTIDAPHARHSTASAPATDTPSPANEATAGESVAGPALLAPDLLVGGFDRSAFDAGSDQPDRELLSAPPDDLAPPIQPRTLQRRLAGARPIEVPPQLRLPSTSPTPPASSPPPMDLPLASPPSAQSTDTGGGGIPAQRVEEPGQAEHPGQAEDTVPLVSDQDPITAQRSADTSTATGENAPTEPPASEPSVISAQRTEDTEQLTEDTEQTEDTAPLASEQGPITAQRSADTATAGGAPAQPDAGSTALPLHTAARSPEAGVESSSGQPARERSGISAQRTEEVAPLAGEQSPLTAQRSADATTTSSATGSSEGATAALPLHTATRSPEAGVGSASEQPARERSGISGERTEDSETTSTIAPLTTTASPERLTDAGSTTREQIGASAGGLPLAPADWQETLQAPPERGEAASGDGSTTPTFQVQREAAPERTAAPAGGPAFFPLAASKPVGAQRPLSSLAPLMPGTTSSVQRSVAAAAAPAPTTTLIRPRATSSGAFAQSGTAAMASPDLPDVITSGALAASMPLVGSSLADAHEGSPPSASGAARDFPLQRATSGASATTSSAAAAPALPLHTPAAAIPTAADIAVSAGLAERGPDGSVHYTQPPAGSQVQREFVIQREGESGVSAPPTSPDPASTAVGNQITSVSPTPGAPDQTLEEKTQALAEQARKLYPHIRNQLESDIRQQLEARSRASGSR